MSKTDRQQTVEALAARLKAAPTVIVTDFTGLSVARITELRRRIRAAGASYVVVKNTLAQRALAANAVAALDDHLAGPTGLVLAGTDPLPVAKVLTDFAREFERPAVRAGFMDGQAVAPAYVKRLGEIPPREVLLAQFAGALNNVLYSMVAALEALREQRATAAGPQ
ncbi:MAG TPA: 50S ribosomal protein L10 [Gemmatimonadales bacterium]|nr:50S ribosomal protein L10 [Gemmatimonadales bacterium]